MIKSILIMYTLSYVPNFEHADTAYVQERTTTYAYRTHPSMHVGTTLILDTYGHIVNINIFDTHMLGHTGLSYGW